MKNSCVVELPIRYIPRFPKRCVACEMPHSGPPLRIRTINISAPNQNLFFFVAVPLCRQCSTWFLVRRWIWVIALVAVAVLCLCAAEFLLPDEISGIAKEEFAKLVGLLFGVGLLVFWVRYPPPFSFWVAGDTITYEFRNAQLANEFKTLNAGNDQKQIQIQFEHDQ